MIHVRLPGDPGFIACGATSPGKIPIWTDRLDEATCCDCLRALGYRPSEVYPDRYSRRHVAIYYRRVAA